MTNMRQRTLSMGFFIVALTVAWILFTLAWSQGLAATALAVRQTISLGGDLAQWDNLERHLIILSNTAEPEPVTQSGYFQIAWDDDYLYVLGVFDQSSLTLNADFTADEQEWWNGDTMELFFRLSPGAPMLHTAANPMGTRFLAYLDSDDYLTFARFEAARWMLEMAVPLGTDFLPHPQVGDSWEFKLGRGHVALQEYSLWPVGQDFLADDNYGILTFAD